MRYLIDRSDVVVLLEELIACAAFFDTLKARLQWVLGLNEFRAGSLLTVVSKSVVR